jgi:hypothetical protein
MIKDPLTGEEEDGQVLKVLFIRRFSENLQMKVILRATYKTPPNVWRSSPSFYDWSCQTRNRCVLSILESFSSRTKHKSDPHHVGGMSKHLISLLRSVPGWYWKTQFLTSPMSGGGIMWVFFSDGKQHDSLKKRTVDTTLENTVKSGINIKLPTWDDKGRS